jgi:hypothetical protein
MKHIKHYDKFVNEAQINEMLKLDMKKLRELRRKVAERLSYNIASLIEDLILSWQIDYYADYESIIKEVVTTLTRMHKPEEVAVIKQIDQEILDDASVEDLGVDGDD